MFEKDYKSKLDSNWKTLKPKLDNFDKFVGHKDFTLGYLTVVDFNIS